MRQKLSNYGLQLREKQKLKKMYGLLEAQFYKFFVTASRAKGKTGEKLLEMLERRVDNVLYKANFTLTLSQARQLVNHNHVTVNNRRVNIPSFITKPGDQIKIKGKEKLTGSVKDTLETLKDRAIPSWLERDDQNLQVTVLRVPTRGDIPYAINEQLIVELYSK
jgi:small subunit ribosomal protein S4